MGRACSSSRVAALQQCMRHATTHNGESVKCLYAGKPRDIKGLRDIADIIVSRSALVLHAWQLESVTEFTRISINLDAIRLKSGLR